jgi:hypothetical protein
MAQIKSKYDEVRLPLTKMSFCPDVPSTQLGPNEYNKGINVECDVRGMRSVAGDEEILSTVPGTPTYVSSGFRRNGEFWFIVATTEGNWYASNGGSWQNITPGGTPFTGYAQNTNITEAWNGTVPFFNDGLNPPMFLPDTNSATLVPYSDTIPLQISSIVTISAFVQKINLVSVQPSAPYVAGESIIITNVNNFFNGTFLVISSDTTSITYTASPGAAYPGGGTVSPKYSWNFNPDWGRLKAGFMRMYSTPNVGSILIAGNLAATSPGNEVNFTNTNPVTIQWSQNFGLNEAPQTWEPTITNVANQLEVPLRGPALDGFPCNGQFFVCSYWDTVVFSPINYSTTSAPILGVRLYNQGRGLLSANCWANTDKLVYGVDARDIWVFDGTNFQGIGNQQVKNWFFDQMDPQYYDRVFLQNNSQKNQIEIYYYAEDSSRPSLPVGVPNFMLAYRYDLELFNAPRQVDSATFSCESPIYTGTTPNLGSRTVVYARGVTNQKLVQKDQSYSWSDGSSIESSFRRDNIKLLKDYSGKLMVHRILPEVVNMGAEPFTSYNNLPIDPADSSQDSHKGNVTVTIYGAESVGSAPASTVPVQMPIDTSSPWCQIDQNAYRVNSLELSNSSNSSIWMCSAATWQVTQVEDDR